MTGAAGTTARPTAGPTARTRRLGPIGGLGLLGALTAAVLAGTALAGPAQLPATVGAAGGPGPFAAAAPAAAGAPAAAATVRPAADEHRVRVRHVRTRARARVHRDDRTRRAVAWRVRTLRAPALDARNLATATAHDCSDCHAVALSVQVVVAGRNERRVEAGNLAVAVTDECVRCTSVALAYQFVVVRPGRLVLTRQARRDLADLRRQMRDVARHRVGQDLVAQEDALAEKVADVLRSGVVDRDREKDRRGEPSTYLGQGSGSGGAAVAVRVRRAHDTARGRADR